MAWPRVSPAQTRHRRGRGATMEATGKPPGSRAPGWQVLLCPAGTCSKVLMAKTEAGAGAPLCRGLRWPQPVAGYPCGGTRVTVPCRGDRCRFHQPLPLTASVTPCRPPWTFPALASRLFPGCSCRVAPAGVEPGCPQLQAVIAPGCPQLQAVHSSRLSAAPGCHSSRLSIAPGCPQLQAVIAPGCCPQLQAVHSAVLSHLGGAACGQDSHPIPATSCLLGQVHPSGSAWLYSLQGHPGLAQSWICCLGSAQSLWDLAWQQWVGSTHSPKSEKWWKEGPDPAPHGQCLLQVSGEGLAAPLAILASHARCHGPVPMVSQGQHFPLRGHWTRPPGSCPMEGVCWVAPTHLPSLGASGQVRPRVPGALSETLLNSRHEVGGGQGPRHCLASELRGLGNPHSWASWGGHVWVGHGPGCSLPAAPPALWGATHAMVAVTAVPVLPY
ncbi:uncharacterized protein LOC130255909 [Oenanthe melanoleuca]|uniref:uncharacterized protein LOC130255909 n=1 Tax=Oenanthe melanoleuca TaxID=2939378 RepID=UPI0024C1B71B|nr:uncharacterized protein LOC130255909 [Oenanthe melanoleuca]